MAPCQPFLLLSFGKSGSLPRTAFSFLIDNYLKAFLCETELGDTFSKAKEQPEAEIWTCPAAGIKAGSTDLCWRRADVFETCFSLNICFYKM